MSVLKKILLSLVVFIMVATGTALSFVPFYLLRLWWGMMMLLLKQPV